MNVISRREGTRAESGAELESRKTQNPAADRAISAQGHSNSEPESSCQPRAGPGERVTEGTQTALRPRRALSVNRSESDCAQPETVHRSTPLDITES